MPKNPIEEYFAKDASKLSKYSELFKGNDDFIDQMTELSSEEIRLLLALNENNAFLSSLGIRPVFSGLSQKFMRLQVSKERKSRMEYVDVHKADEMRTQKKIDGPGSIV